MADTLTLSSIDGGGMSRPPAPPEGGDDYFGEFDPDRNEANRAGQKRLKLSPFIADLSLQGAVFDIGRQVDVQPMPFGIERIYFNYPAN